MGNKSLQAITRSGTGNKKQHQESN